MDDRAAGLKLENASQRVEFEISSARRLSLTLRLVGRIGCMLGSGLWLSLSLRAGPLDMWSQVYPRPTGQNIWSAATDGSNWVAVGVGGTIVVSPDATNWTRVNPIPGYPVLKSVAFGANRWAAVGFAGAIVSSTNAVDWTICQSGTTEAFFAVAYGNGRFLAVGSYGVVASSTNGTEWHLDSTPSITKHSLLGLAFGKAIFVSGGLGGTLQTSTDGVVWAETFFAGHDIHCVNFDGDRFLAGRFNGLVYASGEGTNWINTGGVSAPFAYGYAKYKGNWFCAAGDLWRSSDLTNWTYVPTPSFSSSSGGGTYGVTAAANTLLVVGEAGNLVVSGDGTNFSQCRRGRPLPLASVVRHGKRFIVPSLSLDRLLLTSEDGWNWVERPFGATANQMISDGQLVISVGTRGASDDISISGNGISWTPISIGSRSGLYGVTGSDFGYVAVGGGGVVYVSSDGTHWNSNAIPGAPALRSVAASSNRLVTVGPSGTNYFSIDAIQWAAAASSTTNQLLSVAFGAGRFVAGGARGTIAWSDDGTIWQNMSLGNSITIKRLIFATGQFVAATSSSTFTSPDGLLWTAQTNAPSNLKDICYCEGGFVTLSGSTYGEVAISGKLPLLITAWRESMIAEQFVIETSSVAGEVYAIESSSDLRSWGTAELRTNVLGYGVITAPRLGPTGYYRMRSVSLSP